MKLPLDFNPFLLLVAGAIVGFAMIVVMNFFALDLFPMTSGTATAAYPPWLSWLLDRAYPN